LPIESLLLSFHYNQKKKKQEQEKNSLFHLSIYDIGKYLKLSVRMCSEAGARFNAVFVDHSQTTKFFMLRIMMA